MTRRTVILAGLGLLALPLWAQDQPANPALEEQRLAASRAIWADLPMIRVMDDIGLTPEQALRLQPVLNALQAQFRAIDTRLAGALQAASADIAGTTRALLAGRPAPAAADLARYEQMREQAAREREDAVLTTMTKVNAIITKQQQALLQAGDMAVPPGQPKPRPEYFLKSNEARALWKAQIHAVMLRLLQQGRGEQNAQRYAQLAPQACLQTAQQATGLPPNDGAVAALAKQLLAGCDQARKLPPAEVADKCAKLAGAMVRAVSSTLTNHPRATQGVPPVIVTTAEFDALVRYDRTPLLLQSWIRERATTLTEAKDQPEG